MVHTQEESVHHTVDAVVISDEMVNYIAQAAHEANRVWCEINNDKTNLPWGQSQGHLRAGTRAGVLCMTKKLANGELIDRYDQHAEWVKERTNQGWILGKVYDADKRLHPNLVQFDDLPMVEQCKDSIFISVVRALYEAAQIVSTEQQKKDQETTAGAEDEREHDVGEDRAGPVPDEQKS